ncbi:phosphoglycerate mutase [Amylibacter marinus]|uniref:Phosphoglycerate mutase n=1 Tax=Amylibacter marinus TaxID=1475483 RepID=A0ABQ5VUY5_9RHOB|nr:histidine phosphatase family protein [Amylibacter marinus]GLQ34997.1 phosphoglycerate mutase [Amylibacter marinus]
MTNWWWVRHGPTHHAGLVGWSDIAADLSDSDAIARLDAHLPDDALVVSSDLIRCVATADRLSGTRERLPHTSDLRELHFGDWELKGFGEVAAQDPEISRAYWEDPGDIAPPNGESWNEAAARIARAVARITAAHQGRNIVAVAHFGAILTQIQRATNIPAKSALGFKIDNLSVTRLEHLGQDDWRVHGVNHVL